MPSPTILRYFESLQRCDLQEINDELRQFCLGGRDISLFKDDGVLVLKHVFSDDNIANVVSACERLESLVEKDEMSYVDINLEAVGGGWKGQYGTTVSHTGKIRKVINLIDHGHEFKQMAFHPFLLHIVAGLLGPDFCLHSKGFLMNKPPEVSTEKQWHQDGAYFDTDNQVITIWIPLQDVNEINGCLYAIPGSHSWGKLQHIGAEAQLDPSTLPLDLVRKYPVNKGGICIMDKNIAHYSGTNKSSTARRALIFRYQKDYDHVRSIPNWPAESTGRTLQSYCHALGAIRHGLQTLDPSSGDQEVLRDILETSHKIQRFVDSIIGPRQPDQTRQLGGAVSGKLLRGEKESTIEKRHLIIARVLRQRAREKQTEFIDMGTDYCYPFYDAYKPTQDALRALSENKSKALHYPSSFGLESLRQAFQKFMQSRFGVNLDWKKEIMINTGASQAFDALSRAFEGRYVLLPPHSLPTVGVIAAGNGAELLRMTSDDKNGMIQLALAQFELDKLPPGSVRFLYLNSPVNPTGQVASLDYLEQIVQFAKRNNIIVVHDMDSWYTQHSTSGRLHNILEVGGATDCCITVLSVSKEFGLPGLRVGLIAGNEKVINVIRIHNSTFAVMIPEVCQLAAQAAMESYGQGDEKEDINAHVTVVLQKTIEGWRNLGWPEEAIHPPSGGFKYLTSAPPGIRPQGSFSGLELLDFYIASRANVKLSTSRSFNPTDDRFLRMVLMQNTCEVDEVFRRLRLVGVSYDMTLPEGLTQEYETFLSQHASNDF